MTKLLILDLDGAIRQPKSDNVFINHPHDQRLIPAAVKAMLKYQSEGWEIVGATNQGGVAAGHKTLQDTIDEQRYTIQLCRDAGIVLPEILMCPNYEGNLCYKVTSYNTVRVSKTHLHQSFRKPSPGMLHRFVYIYTPHQVAYVGDRPEDQQAANAANIPFMSNIDWYNC